MCVCVCVCEHVQQRAREGACMVCVRPFNLSPNPWVIRRVCEVYVREGVRTFIHSFIHLFIHSFIHSFIHPSLSLPTGDTQSFPAAPLLLLLSTDGVLIAYHVVLTGAPSLNRPAQPLSAAGMRQAKGASRHRGGGRSQGVWGVLAARSAAAKRT